MIYFTAEEIFWSFFHSIIYGIIFALGIVLIDCIIRLIRGLPQYFLSVKTYKRLLSLPERQNAHDIASDIGAVRMLLYVISFFIGYIILSYFSLDGVFRGYILALSLAALCLTRITLGRIILLIFEHLLYILLCPIIILMRILLAAFRKMTTKNGIKTK